MAFPQHNPLKKKKKKIRPYLKCCSHVWVDAPKSTLCLLDKVHSKAIRLINSPSLTKSLQRSFHFFTDTFTGIALRRSDIIHVPLRRVRTTRSLNHSYPFQVSLPISRTLSHKSSFIPRTCNLWNVLPSSCFLNLTTCHLSNLRSIDLIWSPSLLLAFYFLFSSFIGVLHMPPWPFLNITH